MKHKLLVCVGMPKTGTSSLQKFLAVNNDRLNQYGWNYPDTGDRFRNVKLFESDRYKNSEFVLSTGSLRLSYERLRDSLMSYDTILSDESLWRGNACESLRDLRQKCSDITLVAYLRRQDFAMESWYGQEVKGDYQKETEAFGEWTGRELEKEGNGNLYYRYYDRLMEYEKIIARENIIVRPYIEGKSFSLYQDFLSILNLQDKLDEFHKIERVNVSWSILDTEVKRRWNKMLQIPSESIMEMLQKEYWDAYQPAGGSSSLFRFDRKERKEILDRYAEQNEKVSERYRNGERLFGDEVDFEPARIDQNEVSAQYVRLLEKLLLRAWRGHCFSVLFLLARGKAIAVFGAGLTGRTMIEDGFPAEIMIDNNEMLTGQTIRGIQIVTPEEIRDWKKYFVVVAVKKGGFGLEIEKQLESLNLEKNVDFMHIDDVYRACDMPEGV